MGIKLFLAAGLITGVANVAFCADVPPKSASVTSSASRTELASEFTQSIQPMLQKYCYDCHGDVDEPSGKLKLTAFKTADDVMAGKAMWEKVIRYVHTSQMPPKEEAQPTQEERTKLVRWARRKIYNIDPAKPDPGRVTIHRLNRTEYSNTINDLIGVNFEAGADFPYDDTGYGFDNIGDVLSMPPMLVEKYLGVAEKVIDQAIMSDPPKNETRHFVKDMGLDNPGLKNNGDFWITLKSTNEDYAGANVKVPVDADYAIRIFAYSKTEPVKVSFMVGDTVFSDMAIPVGDQGKWYEARVSAAAGKQNFHVTVRRNRGLKEDQTFTNGHPGTEQAGELWLHNVEVIGPLKGSLHEFSAAELTKAGKANKNGEIYALGTTNDEVSCAFYNPKAGESLIRISAAATFCGDELPKMQVLVNGKAVSTIDVLNPAQRQPQPDQKDFNWWANRTFPRVYELKVPLAQGKVSVAARFLNDAYDAKQTDVNFRDRNLFVKNIEVMDTNGDVVPQPLPLPLKQLFIKYAGPTAGMPNANIKSDPVVARNILRDFARRAWRTTPTEQQIDRLLTLYSSEIKAGATFHAAVKQPLKAILVSPNFLFRDEIQPQPNDPTKIVQVSEFELASRLSYFLWSTTPDDELLNQAEKGELRKNLAVQVKRMIASPKSKALVDNFAAQWLQFRGLEEVQPDGRTYEKWDWKLKESMQKETEMFVEAIIKQDRSVIDFINADWTYVNGTMAKYYGISGVEGDEWKKVSLVGTPRRGVMTQASILTLTSNPNRTSPVKRGKWVLENLLNAAPPPPPPDIPSLDDRGRPLKGTLRQKLLQHQQNPTCASCHTVMDPIGFSLEHFDGVGGWRDRDQVKRRNRDDEIEKGQTALEVDEAIDATGVLPSGDKFDGAIELAKLLAVKRKDDFVACMAAKMLTYALGRGTEPSDDPTIDDISANVAKQDYRFSAMVMGIVNSVPFQMRRGEAPKDLAAATTQPAQVSIGQ